MRKQSGFTLIELMVVMAIIAILATAGLAAYGGYIKKARDAKRLEDIRALQTIAISSLTTNGMSIELGDYIEAAESANNGTLLQDPLHGRSVCLDDEENIGNTCIYQYFQCNNGGYVLRVAFESSTNFHLYSEDKLNAGSIGGATPMTYDIGNCDSITTGGNIE